jgi:predicted short-subunit dehydrogenase-like oxidoreductase (DUF2520 family)
MIRYHISFAGAGRVGAALCREFLSAGHKIDTIVSRNSETGVPFAMECGAHWAQELVFTEQTEIIIVAVPDSQLKNVLQNIKCSPSTLVAHTAGSYGLGIFPAYLRNKGVFYPLQTFSIGRKIEFSDLPVLLESIDSQSFQLLNNLAVSIGAKVYSSNEDQRKVLHLAAVFACNFTNHLFTLGSEIAKEAGFDFVILNPLIRETVAKALENGPEKSQTGPAMRNDMNTINRHLELLANDPGLKALYQGLTESITNYYKTN